MLSCKIGIVSVSSKNSSFYLKMGEVFDQTVRKSIDSLYSLAIDVQCLTYFCATINGKEVELDNKNDIEFIQKKYKMTRLTNPSEPREKCTLRFNKPEIYDLDCMVPLFDMVLPRGPSYKTPENKDVCMFIFMPCEDPLVRYDLVTSCFEYAGNRDPHFFLPDVPRTGEKLSNSFLKRQLLSRGVPQDNITTHDFGKLPDCIAESLIMIKTYCRAKVTCIATASKDMSSLLKHLKVARNMGLTLKNKMPLVCEW